MTTARAVPQSLTCNLKSILIVARLMISRFSQFDAAASAIFPTKGTPIPSGDSRPNMLPEKQWIRMSDTKTETIASKRVSEGV